MKWIHIVVIIVIKGVLLNGQTQIHLSFVPKMGNTHMSFSEKYCIKNDTITITNFKFYISNVQFYKGNMQVGTAMKPVYLVDYAADSIYTLQAVGYPFDRITFDVGIDSLTSVSGVFDGDLDPLYGMYWTWQSGYIHFKLEGTATSCPTRNRKFYWHIGGYQFPFNSYRRVQVFCQPDDHATINIQLDQLFVAFDMVKVNHVMSPSVEAMHIADALPLIFTNAGL